MAAANAVVWANSAGSSGVAGVDARGSSSMAVERLSLSSGWVRSTSRAKGPSPSRVCSRPISCRDTSTASQTASPPRASMRTPAGGSISQSSSRVAQNQPANAKATSETASNQIQRRARRRTRSRNRRSLAMSADRGAVAGGLAGGAGEAIIAGVVRERTAGVRQAWRGGAAPIPGRAGRCRLPAAGY